jgi:hypothetical protein
MPYSALIFYAPRRVQGFRTITQLLDCVTNGIRNDGKFEKSAFLLHSSRLLSNVFSVLLSFVITYHVLCSLRMVWIHIWIIIFYGMLSIEQATDLMKINDSRILFISIMKFCVRHSNETFRFGALKSQVKSIVQFWEMVCHIWNHVVVNTDLIFRKQVSTLILLSSGWLRCVRWCKTDV